MRIGWTYNAGTDKRLENRSFLIYTPSPNVIRAFKLKGMIWMSHVPSMEEMRNAYHFG
jgi:hypothetical protein